MVLLNETLNHVISLDDQGNTKQFDLNPGRSFGSVIKDYGNLDIGNIFAGASFENLAVFGGDKGYFQLIDTEKKILLGERVKTAVEWIRSFQFCKVKNRKVYLSVVGCGSKYSLSETDLFEVGNLVTKVKRRESVLGKRSRIR